MTRRGVTLIELLIALALILATAAIVLPTFDRRLRDSEFTETAQQIRALLTMARAESQRIGEPLEVIYDAEETELEVHVFDPDRVIDDTDVDERFMSGEVGF